MYVCSICVLVSLLYLVSLRIMMAFWFLESELARKNKKKMKEMEIGMLEQRAQPKGQLPEAGHAFKFQSWLIMFTYFM